VFWVVWIAEFTTYIAKYADFDHIIINTILNHKTFYVGLVLYITTVRVSYYSTESDGNWSTDAMRQLVRTDANGCPKQNIKISFIWNIENDRKKVCNPEKTHLFTCVTRKNTLVHKCVHTFFRQPEKNSQSAPRAMRANPTSDSKSHNGRHWRVARHSTHSWLWWDFDSTYRTAHVFMIENQN
jgi:hypothetical protein